MVTPFKNINSAWSVYKSDPPVSKNHNTIAFELLYDKYAPKTFGFICNYAKTKDEAESILMQVFLKVWENIKNFGVQDEQKIIKIVLLECKSLYKINP